MNSLRMRLLVLVFAVMASANIAFAQSRTVTGVVKAADDDSPLPGVQVVVKGTSIGTVTKAKGDFSINVPADRDVIVIKSIGYRTTEVNVKDKTDLGFIKLEVDARQMDEIVVTGVAEGTSTKLLGFAVGKVNEETLKEVPALDAGTALRGKIAGVQIVQPTGVPGVAPEIRLRAVTNIQGTSNPLIVVDGIITPPGTSLADINMNDVASIEVLKGAAAASLYGSQAANGVVQLITKRGSETPGKTDYTYRGEAGRTDLQNTFPLLTTHRNSIDANGNFIDGNLTTANIQRQFDADAFYDNPFPGTVVDQQRELLQPFTFISNYGSVASSQKNTNFLFSLDQLTQPGILPLSPSFNRYNGRLNIDHRTGDFKISSSLLYSSSSGPSSSAFAGGSPIGQRQQGGPFYGILLLEPDFNLYQPNPDGTPYYNAIGNANAIAPGRQGAPNPTNNATNPLYGLSRSIIQLGQQRLLGNAAVTYQFTDWLRAEGQFSYDRTSYNFLTATKKGSFDGAMNVTGGNMTQGDGNNDGLIGTFSIFANRTFDDFTVRGTYRYQLENYSSQFGFTSGSSFSVEDLFVLQNLDRETLSSTSTSEKITAENFFFNLQTDYKEKYILGGTVRRDAVSLFGPDQRSQIFYQVNAAWRVTQDLEIPDIQEWKLRASLGTTGQRPPFAAQYETWNVTGGAPSKLNLGNNLLRPSTVRELEVGTNVIFFNDFSFEFNYATSTVNDAIIQVPLPAYAGFGAQFQNVGELSNNTFEFQLGGQVFKNDDMSLNFNLTASRSRNRVIRTGRAPFSTDGLFGGGGGGGIAGDMFRIAEGEELGVMFGNIHATSLSQLTTNSLGFVNNLRGVLAGVDPLTLKPEDFEVNADGYVVRKGVTGSTAEHTYLLLDTQTNQPLVAEIGNGNPDFLLGFNTTFQWKGLSVYALVDFQIGGDIYNATRQLLYFNNRHGDLDQSGKAQSEKKTDNYYQSLYNGNNSTKHFVESGTFAWLRELNISYTLSNEDLKTVGLDFFSDIRLSVIGRNLFVITNYSGYSPEVALANNSTTYRVDQFVYPLFRSLTGGVQIRF
ncbi:MAG: SusC/RagA family TonB-linked outer membrane protein [Chloroherpetonaceae bacterium]|nr:SusC/RagA family TonB-linked outer membrane protein [Chloroherpetonaceae bacterium]